MKADVQVSEIKWKSSVKKNLMKLTQNWKKFNFATECDTIHISNDFIEFIVHVPLWFALANERAMVKQMCVQIIATFNIRKININSAVFFGVTFGKTGSRKASCWWQQHRFQFNTVSVAAFLEKRTRLWIQVGTIVLNMVQSLNLNAITRT